MAKNNKNAALFSNGRHPWKLKEIGGRVVKNSKTWEDRTEKYGRRKDRLKDGSQIKREA